MLPSAWYDANIERCEAIIAFLDDPTTDKREAMHDACASRQPSMFSEAHIKRMQREGEMSHA
ncbi:MAG: hypothetical protein ACREPQ_09735 [Rhodanobacter sp.]